jgi:hypothetical protein
LTDKSGLFVFKPIDPGSYIVEIVSNDQSILAASQLLNVNADEMVSAVVKLPFRSPAAGFMDRTSTVIAAAAAIGGILALVPTVPVSPVQ